jgi:hypothetical protein
MNWTSLIYVVGAIIITNLAVIYTAYLLYKRLESKSFGLHLIFCKECDSPVIAPEYVGAIDICDNCCTCEFHGKEMTCDNCGKLHRVNITITGISFCDGIGCRERYEAKMEELEMEIEREEKKERAARKRKSSKV